MVYIIRHGQTELNSARVLQGRSDYALNEKGIAQAKSAGDWFRRQGISFTRVYTSPLRRAVQTAQLVAGDTFPIQTDERLIEMDYGPYEGMNLSRPAPEVAVFFRDFVHHPAPAGMEPLQSVTERLGAFLDELRSQNPAGNVLISTHAIAMKGALEYLTPSSRGTYWSKYIGNCAVYRTELTSGTYTIPIEVPIV